MTAISELDIILKWFATSAEGKTGVNFLQLAIELHKKYANNSMQENLEI